MLNAISRILLVFACASSSALWANEQANLLEASCQQASVRSIQVINENGRCTANWKCDETVFRIVCESGQCSCYTGEWIYFNKSAYEACDSDKLMNCFKK